MPIFEEIFHNNNQIYGAIKIHAILKDRGYVVGQQTVADIIHENGWFAISGGAKKLFYKFRKKRGSTEPAVYRKHTERSMGKRCHLLQIQKHNFYICVIRDLFVRKAIACRVSLINSTQLTRGTFLAAYIDRQPECFIFHSDQGRNYTSAAFRSCLMELKVKQSFFNLGNPYNKSFFKIMKTGRLYRTDFHSERELRKTIKNYITFYNKKRPHSVLRYRTPNKCEVDY